MNTAAHADFTEALGILEQRHGHEARVAAERVFAGDLSDAAMAAFGRLVIPAYTHPTTAASLADLARSSFNSELDAYFVAELRPRYDLRARLSEIKVPTLVIVGDYDWLLPPSCSRDLAAAIPGAELVVIPDTGHFALNERPPAVTDAIRRFLRTSAAS